jgi:hypothetical protein
VRSESAVRPIGTERCRTGRAFGKLSQIDLIVLRISERLLPVMMEFQTAAYTSQDPYGIVCYTFVYVNRYKNRTVSIRRPIKITNRTNAFPNAIGAISQTPPTFRPLTERIFVRSDRSDRTDRRFRTHPILLHIGSGSADRIVIIIIAQLLKPEMCL